MYWSILMLHSDWYRIMKAAEETSEKKMEKKILSSPPIYKSLPLHPSESLSKHLFQDESPLSCEYTQQ